MTVAEGIVLRPRPPSADAVQAVATSAVRCGALLHSGPSLTLLAHMETVHTSRAQKGGLRCGPELGQCHLGAPGGVGGITPVLHL